eukprot:m.507716 g.507716  ORF g.507716 m.507716 type:complete len:120 (-) comp57387_c0_seq3:96-455(-)
MARLGADRAGLGLLVFLLGNTLLDFLLALFLCYPLPVKELLFLLLLSLLDGLRLSFHALMLTLQRVHFLPETVRAALFCILESLCQRLGSFGSLGVASTWRPALSRAWFQNHLEGRRFG